MPFSVTCIYMSDFSNFSKYWRENALNESYLLHLAVYSIINKCFRLKVYGQIVICKFKAFYHVIYANLIFPIKSRVSDPRIRTLDLGRCANLFKNQFLLNTVLLFSCTFLLNQEIIYMCFSIPIKKIFYCRA